MVNWYAGCEYGEFPLQFAASVGDKDICDLLVKYVDNIENFDLAEFEGIQRRIRQGLGHDIDAKKPRDALDPKNAKKFALLNAQDALGSTRTHDLTQGRCCAVLSTRWRALLLVPWDPCIAWPRSSLRLFEKARIRGLCCLMQWAR